MTDDLYLTLARKIQNMPLTCDGLCPNKELHYREHAELLAALLRSKMVPRDTFERMNEERPTLAERDQLQLDRNLAKSCQDHLEHCVADQARALIELQRQLEQMRRLVYTTLNSDIDPRITLRSLAELLKETEGK